MEDKGLCPSRKHLRGGEVVGSPYSGSSVPRALVGGGREGQGGGRAPTTHAEYVTPEWETEE